ncbi:tetratricopeptide repeat protein [Chryseobacterium manosquense]|uniref:Tetratricopeptide repeat protein n=1 Tax=Chryseobacterium manosquense TaxID=2754694 RepID=A0A7H1DXH9_9FLAO|nr:adenylate/guanylate cyclase domain-containing protein [Chryseobacterium manosquense]QNS41687.1 tetratricopeptide repeat protein [Chryseobacterium manosquense]
MKISSLILCFIAFIGCYSSYLFSQKSINNSIHGFQIPADSLIKIGEKHQEKGDLAKSIEFFEKGLVIYEASKDYKKIGDCYSYIAISHYYNADYPNAISNFEISRKNYERVGYTKGISSINNNIGGIYNHIGNYVKSLEYYQNVLKNEKRTGNKDIIAATTQNIGVIYTKLEDYEKAIEYLYKANEIFYLLKDEKGIAQNLTSLAHISIKQKKYDEAQNKLEKSLKIITKKKDDQLKLDVLLNLGLLYHKQSFLKKSLEYYKDCLLLSKKMDNRQYLSESKIAIGKIYNQFNENKSAINYCKSGLNIANEINSLSLKKDACDCLYEGYKCVGNTKLALNYFEKSKLFKDSLNINETSNKMMSMEFQNKQLLDSLAFVNKQHAVQLKHTQEIHEREKQRNYILGTLGLIVLLAGGLYNRLNFVRKSKKALQFEKERSEKLLLNILPEEIAEELKEKGSVNARDFNLVAILFTDFKSFTQTAELMTPQELVEEINICFKAFDLISEKYNIEKIKTIGDAYMAAGGIPIPDDKFLENIVLAGLEMQEFMLIRKYKNDLINKPAFEMRLGIHSGPIVAGIVGIRKFQYDVWGDTVNTASRIESNGTVGKVNISESLYQLLKNSDLFDFEYRGNIHAKGKGNINMYYVEKKSSKKEIFKENELFAKNNS